jgi:hypothetical protein
MHYSIQIDADSPADLAAAIAGLLQVNAHITLQTKAAQAQLAQRGQPATTATVVVEPGNEPNAVTETVAEKVDPPKQPRRKKTDPVQPAPEPITLTAEPAPTAAETVKEQLTESLGEAAEAEFAGKRAAESPDRETVRKALTRRTPRRWHRRSPASSTRWTRRSPRTSSPTRRMPGSGIAWRRWNGCTPSSTPLPLSSHHWRF